jgi:hypothetical protein
MTTSEYRRSEAFQPITITAQMKQRLTQDNADRRLGLNQQRRDIVSKRDAQVRAISDAQAGLSRLNSDLTRIDQQLQENLKEQLTISRLSVGDYNVVNFGLNADYTNARLLKDTDYAYSLPSRSGGKRPHNVTWDEANRKWSCACDGGINRGYCWATKAVASGVQYRAGRGYTVTDDRGYTYNVNRFRKD